MSLDQSHTELPAAAADRSTDAVAAWRIALLACAAFCLGMAINMREGMYCRGAVLWLTAAVAACFAAMLRPSSRLARGCQRASALFMGSRLPVIVLATALAVQFVELYGYYPGSLWNAPAGDARKELSQLKDDATWIRQPDLRAASNTLLRQRELAIMRRVNPVFEWGLLAAAALAAAAGLPWRWAQRVTIPLIFALHFALGAWLLHQTPHPHIDVYVFQQEGAEALLHGQNPYAQRFTNIYGENAFVYGPGLKKRDTVDFGFPYPPLSLLMALPGYVLAGDVRYSHLLALTLAGALIFLARPGWLSLLAALLLLFSPRAFMVAEMAWTEPFVILLLAATVFCAVRMPRLTPYALGLLLASKQYMIFAIPLAALLLPRPLPWRQYLALMLKAALVAAAVSLPMALWNVREFIASAVTLQLKQPFRPDSLSYLAWLNYQLPGWLAQRLERLAAAHPWTASLVALPAFAAAAGGIVLALRRLGRGPSAFAWGMALVYLLFLAVNKQAFCNYYFLVIACFCAAVALSEPPSLRTVDRECAPSASGCR